jgi:hypothetical protein
MNINSQSHLYFLNTKGAITTMIYAGLIAKKPAKTPKLLAS